MRCLRLSALCAACVFGTSTLVVAQEDEPALEDEGWADEAPEDDGYGGEETSDGDWGETDEGAEGTYETAVIDEPLEAETSPSAAPSGGTEVGGLGNAPEEYVVQEGDTLWDLCQRFLNSPWYWPKIWSYNPEIENPHWIYPGNRIRFYPGAGALPSQMEPVAEELEEPDELENDELFEDPSNIPEKYRKLMGRGRTIARNKHFVTKEELKDAGVIAGSMDEAEMLTIFQRVYIKLNSSAQPGQQYEIFRIERELRHPVTGSRLGYVTQILGRATVDRVDGEQGVAVIDAAHEPILRGDKLGPVSSIEVERMQETPNSRKLKGYIVDTSVGYLSMAGEAYIVFVDKGTQDGVENGNSFIAVRAGDGFTEETEDFLDEDIGELVVIDARDEVSTALVTRSNRELFPGDRVEMRVSN